MDLQKLDNPAKLKFLKEHIQQKKPNHEVLSHGIKVFNGESGFISWFFRQNKAMGGISPYQCFFNNPTLVDTILGRIEHGVYS